MAIINCTECGKEVSNKATTCPQCGYPLSPIVTSLKTPKKPLTKLLKTLLFLQIILLTTALILVDTSEFWSIIAGSLSLFVAVLQIIFGILSTIRSLKSTPKKGLILSLFSTFLSLILVVPFIFFVPSPITEENQGAYTATLYSILDIRDHVKNPSSVIINEVYVKIESRNFTLNGKEISDEFSGYYHIYIDFTADNALGGSDREIAYFCRNQDYDNFIPLGASSNSIQTVSSIPKNDENMIKLSADVFNNFDYASVG